MNKKPYFVVILILFSLSFTGYGQEAAERISLRDQTLPLDIDTSDFYELLDWCRRLELDEKGTREDLRNRLYAFYNLEQTKPEKTSGDLLSIDRSHTLEYYTQGEKSHNYIRFEGGVVLSFTEESTGTVHRITTDTLLFNKDARLLTALGNVEYILEKENTTERFKGESLIFNINDWSGFFLNGMSEKQQEKEEDIKFYYSGEVIYRSAQDTVILEDGVVTTCDDPHPHITIKAKKIWVLAPGEWALFHALFYVGRVPLFYLPGFLKNGDPFFFNPVFGFEDDKGFLVQTTSYILGKKPRDEDEKGSLIGFLQRTDEEKEREIRGAFLVPSDGLSPFQIKLRKYADTTGSFLKVMADGYSYRGGFLGVEGLLNKISLLEKLKIYTALGLSREVFLRDGAYTPLERNEEGRYVSNWEGSSFLGFALPFRYAFDVETRIILGPATVNLDFPLYSDPFFLEDFNNRQENIDWSGFLNKKIDLLAGENSQSLSTLRWSAGLSLRPSLKNLSPLISSLSLNKMEASMTLGKRDIPVGELTDSITAFFYPQNFYLPDMSLNMGGTIFSRSASIRNDQTKKEEQPENLLKPWDDIAEGKTGGDEKSEGSYLWPDRRGTVSLPEAQGFKPWSHSLTYRFTPTLAYFGTYDTTGWLIPEDIDYSVNYRSVKTRQAFNLAHDLAQGNGLFQMKNNITLNYNYQERFDKGDSITEATWLQYLEQDKQATSLKISGDTLVTINPLVFYQPFQGTRISYDTGIYLYQFLYNTDQGVFESKAPRWDLEGVQKNSVTLDLRYLQNQKTQSLKITSVLPPLLQKQTAAASFSTGPLNTMLTISRREEVNSQEELFWTWDPLIWQEKLTLFEGGDVLDLFGLDQGFKYDMENREWINSETSLKLLLYGGGINLQGTFNYNLKENHPETFTGSLKIWPLSLSLVMRYTESYQFDLEQGWLKESYKSFQPELFKADLKYRYDSDPEWKNRLNWGVDLSSSWNINLLRFTDSPLYFNLSFTLKIFEFLDLKLSSQSENRAAYRYIPGLAETLGLYTINPFIDIFKSFNFFNSEHRRESNFNLNKLNVGLVHNLHDWDLTLEYSAAPEKVLDPSGYYQYEWKNSFSIYVQWKAQRDLEARISVEKNEFVF